MPAFRLPRGDFFAVISLKTKLPNLAVNPATKQWPLQKNIRWFTLIRPAATFSGEGIKRAALGKRRTVLECAGRAKRRRRFELDIDATPKRCRRCALPPHSKDKKRPSRLGGPLKGCLNELLPAWEHNLVVCVARVDQVLSESRAAGLLAG